MTSPLILDGGMGRELARRDAPFRQPEWSALALMEAPDIVRDTHFDFIRAGAQVIMTNSYALVPFHIGQARFEQEAQSLAALAGKLACEAVAQSGRNVRVAASLPPLFGSYRPDLFQPETAAQIAQPLIAGQAPYADIWLAETQSSIQEPQTLKPLLPDDGKPFWVSFSLDDCFPQPPQLRSGERVRDAVQAMIALGADAVLFNCSQPETMLPAIQEAVAVLQASHTKLHLGVYANAFEPDDAEANDGLSAIRQDTTPDYYLAQAQQWLAAGATMIGGCCGIGPEHIARLAQGLKA